jgi:DNA-directed RNA polymerase subunit M/transcription elongation factor TFIIS
MAAKANESRPGALANGLANARPGALANGLANARPGAPANGLANARPGALANGLANARALTMLVSGLPLPEPAALSADSRRRAVASLEQAVRRSAAPEAVRRFSCPRAAARALEHGVAVWSETKAKPYARKLYSILWALRCEDRLLQRTDPWELAFLREESLVREDSSTFHQTLAALNTKLDVLEGELKARIAQPRRPCPRCGSTDMERIAVQTRSADEGMTMMLQCTQCSQRVRI